MTDWGPIDTLELAWAREYREARHPMAEVCNATQRDLDEWHFHMRTGRAAAPSSDAHVRRVGIISQAIFEGWSIKDIARRARAPRAFVAAVGARLPGLQGAAEVSTPAIPPLNGVKTHPLSDHARECLRQTASSPVPAQRFNPGVVNRLLREGLVEIVQRPSVFARSPGKMIAHLKITPAGAYVLERGE